ncbi:hypothetical protein PM8797T_21078 [Gimesia maris DSM 8797]|nr:hypothetical protein PM8797T_21078 [Gimesia maris DSM 8797]
MISLQPHSNENQSPAADDLKPASRVLIWQPWHA